MNKRDYKIKSVQVKPYNFRLKTPFKIATGEYYDMPGAIIQVTLEDRTVGFGEAQAYDTLLNEDSTTILKAVSKVAREIEGKKVFDIAQIIDLCEERIPKDRAAMCGIDMAVYDAAGKASNLPVSYLLGGTSFSVKVNAVLSMGGGKQLMKNLEIFISKGYKIFKIKIGQDFERELDLIKRVREKVGGGLIIFVDVNTAWKETKDALEKINQLAKFNIAWVEQPLPYDDIEGLKQLKKSSPIPIMLDESLYTPTDAYRLISEEAGDMVNIKLSKSGGLYNALKIAAIAKSAGKEIMLGSNLETGLGCLAGYQFAKAVDCITTAMGVFSLMDNDFKHPLVAKDGYLEVTEELAGLGYSYQMNKQLEDLFK
ncbi:dipeptide epimerase [Candidatus Daviesbacteria bacterium]|nr:dipeptide epimerase [Candidatus Daviesbacteria bacterium]